MHVPELVGVARNQINTSVHGTLVKVHIGQGIHTVHIVLLAKSVTRVIETSHNMLFIVTASSTICECIVAAARSLHRISPGSAGV